MKIFLKHLLLFGSTLLIMSIAFAIVFRIESKHIILPDKNGMILKVEENYLYVQAGDELITFTSEKKINTKLKEFDFVYLYQKENETPQIYDLQTQDKIVSTNYNKITSILIIIISGIAAIGNLVFLSSKLNFKKGKEDPIEKETK